MGRAPRIMANLFLVVFGYAVSVLVAVAVAEALMLAPSALPDAGRWGSIAAGLRDLPAMFWGGVLITAFWALPGFLLAIGLAGFNRWRGWGVFGAMGAANAVFSLTLYHAYLQMPPTSMPPGLLLSCIPGGFSGAVAYWAVAGRFIAPRRSMPA